MFIHSKAKILIHGEGQQTFLLEAGALCMVPEWVAKHPDFNFYVKAGKIIIAEGKKESEIERASVKADIAKAEAQKLHEEKVIAEEEKPAKAAKTKAKKSK